MPSGASEEISYPAGSGVTVREHAVGSLPPALRGVDPDDLGMERDAIALVEELGDHGPGVWSANLHGDFVSCDLEDHLIGFHAVSEADVKLREDHNSITVSA
jgi:hypothetical protein